MTRKSRAGCVVEDMEYEIGQCEKFGDPFGHRHLFNRAVQRIKQLEKQVAKLSMRPKLGNYK